MLFELQPIMVSIVTIHLGESEFSSLVILPAQISCAILVRIKVTFICFDTEFETSEVNSVYTTS